MNNPLVQASAKHLLARPEVASAADATDKTQRMFRLAYGRDASADELAWARQFTAEAAARPAAWEELAQGLLLANEFVFVD